MTERQRRVPREGDTATGGEYRGVQALECTAVGEQWLSRWQKVGLERSSLVLFQTLGAKVLKPVKTDEEL